MKNFDYRILIGSALVLGGGLMLLDKLGVLSGVTDFLWAGLLAIAALYFIYGYFSNRDKWWAAIPGFALLGMAASALLLDDLGWGGAAFLGGLGIGFWAVYLRTTQRWWAIIPGGVLLTLAATSAMGNFFPLIETDGVFFAGLGLTFLLVALLAKAKWAYIPAAILLVIGLFLGTPLEGWWEYAWIGVLLLGGIVLIIGSLRK